MTSGELSQTRWSHLKKTAQKTNREFTITKEYIYDLFLKQDRKCALSGVPITFGNRAFCSNYSKWDASLDRIDSSKDYIEGNVQWVHKNVNRMKWELDEQYFVKMCGNIYNLHKEKGLCQ